MLRNRPDVAESERLTAAASELIGASRANFFPKVALLALGGTQDTNFRLFNPENLFGTIGPTIDIPLFDAGLRQAELEIAKAQFTQAAENYRATVLRALKEVQDHLSSLAVAGGGSEADDDGGAAARKAADLSSPSTATARRLSRRGDGAERRARGGTAGDRAAYPQLVADIGLMLALGGGWTAPPLEPRFRPGFAPYLAD